MGRKTHYQYNPEGRVTQITDALEKNKYLSWNTCGQLLSYRDCSNAQTLYHYDAHGRLRESINARGEHTHFRYDARGYLVESERPDGRIDRYEIDVAGQLTRYIDPAQKSLQFRYNRSGRLVERTDAMGYSVKFRYDAYGRLLQLINENGESYRFGWDELDRLVAQQDLDGSSRLYAYNVLDEVTGLTHVPSPDEQPPLSDNAPPTRTTAIRHDFERDAIGRLLSKRTEDGTTDYGYDAADNLLSITFTDNKGEQQRLDYTYDANGQLLSETNSAGLLQTAMTRWAPAITDVNSDPDVIHSRSLPAFMTGIQHTSRLDHHEFRLRLCRCSVLYPTRHHIQLARLHMHAALWEIDAQEAFEYQKRFIGLGVRVPNEFTFDANHLELVVVHFRDHPWTPLLLDKRSFLSQVHRLRYALLLYAGHGRSSLVGATSLSNGKHGFLVRSCNSANSTQAFQPTQWRYAVGASEVPGHVALIVKACGEGGIDQGEAVQDQPAKTVQAP